MSKTITTHIEVLEYDELTREAQVNARVNTAGQSDLINANIKRVTNGDHAIKLTPGAYEVLNYKGELDKAVVPGHMYNVITLQTFLGLSQVKGYVLGVANLTLSYDFHPADIDLMVISALLGVLDFVTTYYAHIYKGIIPESVIDANVRNHEYLVDGTIYKADKDLK